MVIVIISRIAWVTLYTHIGGIVIARRANLDTGNRYRFGIANVINYLEVVIVGFLYFQVINVAVLIQVQVIYLVSRVINSFLQRLRVGAGFNKLGKLIYIETGSSIVFNSYIILLWLPLVARRNQQY